MDFHSTAQKKIFKISLHEGFIDSIRSAPTQGARAGGGGGGGGVYIQLQQGYMYMCSRLQGFVISPCYSVTLSYDSMWWVAWSGPVWHHSSVRMGL